MHVCVCRQCNIDGDGARRFRLHVSPNGLVEALSCLGEPSTQPVTNMQVLCGLHEKVLNNLVARFHEGLVADFYAFFDMAWAVAVFHDRFRDFLEEINSGVLRNPVRLHLAFCITASSC